MGRDIVVIGGSAGAFEPLQQVVSEFPARMPAAVFVVLHLPATSRSSLAAILNRTGSMQAVVPRDGDPVRPGFVYVPTPDHHLEVHDHTIKITRGPKINGVRPAVDVLFRSAAACCGPRVVGVVLSGGLDDGSAGLAAICAAGGIGIVQDPADAVVPWMPRNALETAGADHVLTADRIGSMILHTIHDPEPAGRKITSNGGLEMKAVGVGDTPGQVTGITCPECHGSIWMQKGEGGQVAFTCRVGHSYSPESFFDIQAENVENALWAGVRSLEEQSSLADVMADRSLRMDDGDAQRRYEERSRVARDNAEVLRKLILERSEA